MTSEFLVLRYRWVILGIAWLAFFTSWVPRIAYSPLIPEMIDALQLTYTQAGLLMASFWVGYLIMQFPSGLISDKIGVRRIIIIALILNGVSCALTGVANTFLECFTYRFFNGIACGCLYASSVVIILRWFHPDQRTIATGILTTGASIGQMLAFATSPIISTVFGSWRWSFWLLSIPAFVAALFAATLIREAPKSSITQFTPKNSKTASTNTYKLIFKSKPVWLLWLVLFGLGLVGVGVITWSSTYFMERFEISSTYAGFIMSIRSILGIPAGLSAGFIADKILKRRAPILFSSLFIVGICCLIISKSNLHFTIVILLLQSFFSSMGWAVWSPISAEWFPLEILGTVAGFLISAGGIGGFVGPWVFGAVLEATTSFALSWIISGIIGTALSLLAIPVIWMEKRKNLP